jgi:hypothetical protein
MKRLVSLGILISAVSLVAAPAFGQAYGGEPRLDCTAGVVVGDHFRPSSSPAVVVDGEVVGHADVSNDGTFTFTLPDSVGSGSHAITVAGTSATLTCGGGQVLGEVVVPPAAGNDAGGLAFTGTQIALLAVTAVALVGLGIAMVTLGRRRRLPVEGHDLRT